MHYTSVTLFDDERWNRLLPLTFTRPVCEIRIGITTVREKWEYFTTGKISYFTESYLQKKFSPASESVSLFANSGVIPSSELLSAIDKLQNDQALVSDSNIIAFKSNRIFSNKNECLEFARTLPAVLYPNTYIEIQTTWDIFKLNDLVLRQDFEILSANKTSQKLSATNTLIGDSLFIEEGARIEAATINTTSGPVYIGRDAEVMEGSVIRGPFALGEHSTVKMAAKIYGATTIGPHCKVGGEINNAVIFGYSNKAHDGFLGNAVIGEWCNLGADTNNSNLKNNYAEVKLWDYGKQKFMPTGLQFCGLIMGDHSKCGINTMFNTGTVVGVSANIFGAGFPRNYIPSFSWGGSSGFTTFKIDQALEVAEQVMQRRQLTLTETEKEILTYLFYSRDTKSISS